MSNSTSESIKYQFIDIICVNMEDIFLGSIFIPITILLLIGYVVSISYYFIFLEENNISTDALIVIVGMIPVLNTLFLLKWSNIKFNFKFSSKPFRKLWNPLKYK